MSQHDTVSRILDAAETLFAEKGFTETSLRAITERAKVNLAAVNYHFGSKKELIQAVFARFLEPFCKLLDRNLNEFEASRAGEQTDLESVLGVLAATLKQTMDHQQHTENNADRVSVFLRLLGLAYTQSQGHMRRFLRTNYHSTYYRIISVVQSSRPDITANDLFWRIHFAIGSMIFTFSSFESLRAIAEKDINVENSLEDVIEMLMSYMAGGINHN